MTITPSEALSLIHRDDLVTCYALVVEGHAVAVLLPRSEAQLAVDAAHAAGQLHLDWCWIIAGNLMILCEPGAAHAYRAMVAARS